jgi:hypothetical protein
VYLQILFWNSVIKKLIKDLQLYNGRTVVYMNRRIIKIRKDSEGDITDVMLSNGDICPLNHAISLAREGALEGVQVSRGKDGGLFMRVETSDMGGQNLSNLPSF